MVEIPEKIKLMMGHHPELHELHELHEKHELFHRFCRHQDALLYCNLSSLWWSHGLGRAWALSVHDPSTYV